MSSSWLCIIITIQEMRMKYINLTLDHHYHYRISNLNIKIFMVKEVHISMTDTSIWNAVLLDIHNCQLTGSWIMTNFTHI